MRVAAIVSAAAVLTSAWTTVASAQDSDGIFIVRSAAKTPEAVVAAIKAYSDQKQWQYLGDGKVRNGEVTLVKLCIPEVGRLLWPVGLQLSALLPCGNIGVYSKGATVEISVLHPRYLPALYPHAATERAAAVALPLLDAMLDAVAK